MMHTYTLVLEEKNSFNLCMPKMCLRRVEGQLLYEHSVIVDGMVRPSYLIGPLYGYCSSLRKDLPLRVDPTVCVASHSLLMRAFVVTFIMYALLKKDTNSPCQRTIDLEFTNVIYLQNSKTRNIHVEWMCEQ